MATVHPMWRNDDKSYVPLLIMAAAAMSWRWAGWAHPQFWDQRAESLRRPITMNAESTHPEQHLERRHVRYYLVAMTFIVFDIEVVFVTRGP